MYVPSLNEKQYTKTNQVIFLNVCTMSDFASIILRWDSNRGDKHKRQRLKITLILISRIKLIGNGGFEFLC